MFNSEIKLENYQEYDEYSSDDLCVQVYNQYLSEDSSKTLFKTLFNDGNWVRPHITEKGEWSKRRNKIIYADDGLDGYTINYRGEQIKSCTNPWSDMPMLDELRDLVSQTAGGQYYHSGIVQLYNSGHVGIQPHKDKEVSKKSIIASVSLGITRVLMFSRCGYRDIEIPLKNGCLCLILPPTNNFWLHSVPVHAGLTGKRMSIVFRHSLNFDIKT